MEEKERNSEARSRIIKGNSGKGIRKVSEDLQEKEETFRISWFLWGLTSLSFLMMVYAIFVYAPTEKQEGLVQRIMYYHIPSAWLSFFAFFIVFASSILYFGSSDRSTDSFPVTSLTIFFQVFRNVPGPLGGG